MIKDDERKKDQHRIEDFPAEIISWIGLYLDYPSYKSLSVTNKAMYCTMWGASANAYSKHIEKQPEPAKVDIKAELKKLNNDGELNKKNFNEVYGKYLSDCKKYYDGKSFINKRAFAGSNIKNNFKKRNSSYNPASIFFRKHVFFNTNILDLIEDSISNDNGENLLTVLKKILEIRDFPDIGKILKSHGWEMVDKGSVTENFYKKIFFICILADAKSCIKAIDTAISLLRKDIRQTHEAAFLEAKINLFSTESQWKGEKIDMQGFIFHLSPSRIKELLEEVRNDFLQKSELQLPNKNYITPAMGLPPSN